MEGKELIRVTDEKGIEKDVEVISYFKLKSNNKYYLVYTENKEDNSGNVLTHISEVQEDNDTVILKTIDNPEILNEIKSIIIETINAEE